MIHAFFVLSYDDFSLLFELRFAYAHRYSKRRVSMRMMSKVEVLSWRTRVEKVCFAFHHGVL